MTPARSAYPAQVPPWLTDAGRRRVLDVGSGRGALARMLVAEGHRVHCLDHNIARLEHLAERLPTAQLIAGQVESLPFDSCRFEVVTAAQTLHLFAPGLALAEIARVLQPGGHLAIAYNTRDDTVPWVRKLIAIMQKFDPEAMRGDFGTESVATVEANPYFVDLVRKDFRNWVPITRAGLLDMVAQRPSAAALSTEAREDLLAEVSRLYEEHARVPEPLLLPFKTSCWRATVDHTELTLVDIRDDALEIPLTY